MPTHAELTVRLLKDAAIFFRNMGDTNPDIRKKMAENAALFDQMADTLERAPEGSAGGVSHGKLAGEMLQNAAHFFRTIAEQYEPIREQMSRSANIYEQMAVLVEKSPLGVMD
jgi:hypothetical protein